MDLVLPRGAEAPLAPLCAVKRLGDSVSLIHHKLCVRVFEHHDTNIVPVILVHQPGPDVNVLLPGEAGPQSDLAVGSVRDKDLDVLTRYHLTLGFHRVHLYEKKNTVKVCKSLSHLFTPQAD